MSHLSSESCCMRAIASLEASDNAMYSASIVETATVVCFLEVQEIGDPFSIKR